MGSYHKIDKIRIEGGVLSLIVDDQEIKKALSEVSPLLAAANDMEVGIYEVSPSGYGIHWPLLDEDISIDGLLGIVHSPAQRKQSA